MRKFFSSGQILELQLEHQLFYFFSCLIDEASPDLHELGMSVCALWALLLWCADYWKCQIQPCWEAVSHYWVVLDPRAALLWRPGIAWTCCQPTSGWGWVPRKLVSWMGGWGSGTWANYLVGWVHPGHNSPKWGFQNGTCQHQCSSGRPNSPASVSPGVVTGISCLSGRPRSANRFDPGFCHCLSTFTVSVLGVGACEILCASFKIVVSIS